MPSLSAFAETAALIGEPARATMLTALLDGRALTAGELARAAGIAPQTASLHLARLTRAGLLAVERQGRHRYHRLANVAVARMLEGILAVAEQQVRAVPRTGPRDQALREARTCYDHLAGRFGVALTQGMLRAGELDWSADGGALTASGEAKLGTLGIDVARLRGRGRTWCRPCLDWSERVPHLAGAVGAALCERCIALGWVKRLPGTRALLVTPEGRRGARAAFGLGVDAPSCSD